MLFVLARKSGFKVGVVCARALVCVCVSDGGGGGGRGRFHTLIHTVTCHHQLCGHDAGDGRDGADIGTSVLSRFNFGGSVLDGVGCLRVN